MLVKEKEINNKFIYFIKNESKTNLDILSDLKISENEEVLDFYTSKNIIMTNLENYAKI